MKQSFLFILTTILSIQIYSIELHVYVPAFAAGVIGEVQEVKQRFFDRPLLTAELSSINHTEYDSITFVGDVLLARNVEHLMNKHGGSYPFDGLDLTQFSQDSAVVGNFEAAIPEKHVWTPVGQIDFSVPSTSISYLADAGFTHVSLGNNHSFDFEESGFINTTRVLSSELEVFGLPNDVSERSVTIVDIDDQQVALLGIHGLVDHSDAELRQLFRYANRESDLQVVYVHWGEEYALRQNSNQRSVATKYIEYGADLIIGHHPHVVQGIEVIEGVPVFYSLGNYIFDQYFSKDVQEGLVVLLDLDDAAGIHIIPVESKNPMSQPRFMDQDDHSNFLTTLAAKSDDVLAESIKTGYIPFGTIVASSTKMAMIDNK